MVGSTAVAMPSLGWCVESASEAHSAISSAEISRAQRRVKCAGFGSLLGREKRSQ